MKYIIANWKMNMDLKRITSWVEYYRITRKFNPQKVQVIVAPSHINLALVYDVANSLKISLASQDVSNMERGAHTGENGAFQIKEFCSYSIVGHSERKEPRELVYEKREICLKEGIVPIVCFTKVSDALDAYKSGCFIAWEDPANISKNGEYKEKDPKEIEKGVNEIRSKLPTEAILIYGGSVNKDNIPYLASMKGLDGVLVGNASLDSEHFVKIIDTISQV